MSQKSVIVRSVTESWKNTNNHDNDIININKLDDESYNLFDCDFKWYFNHKGKDYLRSSNTLNVYDIKDENKIIGTWNEKTQKIEFL